MNVHYALYDQSYANGSQYWTWFPEEISQSLRNEIASKQWAFQMRPKNANELVDTDILGGIINCRNEWLVVYRFFDGRNDPQGRPGRGVMMTAWVRADEANAEGADLFPLMNSPEFLRVQNNALTQCPISPPARLTESFSAKINRRAGKYRLYNSTTDFAGWEFSSSDEVKTFAEMFPQLACRGVNHLKIALTARVLYTFSDQRLDNGVVFTPLPKPEVSIPDEQAPVQTGISFQTLLLFVLAAVLVTMYLTAGRGKVVKPYKTYTLKETNPSSIIITYEDSQKGNPDEKTTKSVVQIPCQLINIEETALGCSVLFDNNLRVVLYKGQLTMYINAVKGTNKMHLKTKGNIIRVGYANGFLAAVNEKNQAFVWCFGVMQKAKKDSVEPDDSKKIKQEQLEQKQLDQEKMDQEQLEQEQLEQEQLEQEQLEQEQLEQEQLKQEQLKQEQLKQEQLKQEQLKQEQLKQEQLKQEQLKQEQLEQEQMNQEQMNQEQMNQEQMNQEQMEQEQMEQEQLNQKQLEQERNHLNQ